MKLLFDQNISPAVARNLNDLFPGSDHVYQLKMHEGSDVEIWDFARLNEFMVVTKDADFSEISMQKGFPPKVLWLRIANCTTDEIEQLLRARHNVISSFAEDAETGVLSLFVLGTRLYNP